MLPCRVHSVQCTCVECQLDAVCCCVQLINHAVKTIKLPLFTVAVFYVYAWIIQGLIYLLLIYWAKDETNLNRYLLYRNDVCPSVRLIITSIAQWFMRGLTWDLVYVELWYLACECMLFLRPLCWAHERFRHAAVVLCAIIFGHVKF